MKKALGFTLIEVMIVVVIVAILASIAYPSYQNSIRKTRRADAKEALTSIAALQERYFFTNNSYAAGATPAARLAALGVSGFSKEGYYALTISAGPTCGTSPNTYPCYEITATPLGAQTADLDCVSFSISQSGKKTAKKKVGASLVDNTANCW